MHRRALIALCALAAMTFGGVAASSASALPKALIDESTVIGGTESQEAKSAEKAGLEVKVVSDETWKKMTQAEFGQYQLLIVGDPACSTLPEGVIAGAGTYGPVVMGTAGGRTAPGNRVLVGTDPVLHDGGSFESPGARGTIIRQGIAYAGEQSGRTGMYFDASCAGEEGQASQIVEILEKLSTGTPAWTIDSKPPCGGNVSLIASNPAFNEVTTASLEGWGCSVHESFPTFPSEWSALAVATDTESHPSCGVDPGTGEEACGEAYILIAGSGIKVTSEEIELTPGESTNPVGTDHTVTAHVTSEKAAVAGQLVTFTVTGVNAGASGTCVPADCKTDASGNVTFTYHDTNGEGEDTIKASFTNKSGSLESATAFKHWGGGGGGKETRVSTSLSGGGQSGATITVKGGTAVTDTASLSGEDASSAGGTVTYSIYGDSKCEGPATAAGTVTVTDGKVPSSEAETLPAGVHYWQASYSGDANNAASKSECGSEVETVEAASCSKVEGEGSLGEGHELVRVKDKLSTDLSTKARFQRLRIVWDRGKEVFGMRELERAKCRIGRKATAFRGNGEGTLNGVNEYLISFAIKITSEGEVIFKAVIRNEKTREVIATFGPEELQGSTESIF